MLKSFDLVMPDNSIQEATLKELAQRSIAIQQRAGDAPMWADESRYWVSHDGSRRLKMFMGLADEKRATITSDLGFLTTHSFELVDGVWECVSINHYMPIDWAVREIEESEQHARAQISDVIRDEVQRGLNRVADDYVSRLKQIDAQIAALNAERNALEVAEAKRQARKAKREAAKRQSRGGASSAGYVYLLRALHDPSLFKIGRTNNPDNRLRIFAVKLPYPVEYDCLISTDDMYALESELHAQFADKRLEGEWFRLDEDDVAYIRQRQTVGDE